MSINKFAVSVALAGILGANSALAETDGAFVGVQFGLGGANAKSEYATVFAAGSGASYEADATKSASSFRYGFLAGYKQFFTEKFGLRYYGVIDFGTQSEHKIGPSYNVGASPAEAYFNFTETIKISTLNLNANVDALYNFEQNDSFEFGVFGGLSLGYTSYKAQSVAINGANLTNFTYSYKDLSASGFDFGINFGLRTNIAQNHGIELYSRFSLLKQKDDYKYALDEQTAILTKFEVRQPYAVGLRYSFSF